MKLTPIDKKILELLHKNRHGLGNYEIARTTKIEPAYVFRRLRKMCLYGILERIAGSPVIYRINLKKTPELTFLIVECPKCEWQYKVHYKQFTKQCDNPNCLTRKGKQTRFYISDKRIIDSQRII